MPEETQEHQTDTTPPKTTTLQPDSHTTPMDSPATEQIAENLTSPPDPPNNFTPTPMAVQFPSNGATLQTLTRITPLTNLYRDVPEWPLNPTSQLRETKPPPLLETINGL